MTAGPFDNLDKKTFKQAIMELLESEYKLVGSHKVIELIAEDVNQSRYKYSSKQLNNDDKKLGSLSWVTTSDKNDKPSLGQKIRSCATVSKRIQEYHEQNDDILSLKGYILDMGRGTTHKRRIY